MKRHELSAQQWELIAPLFPPRRRRRGGQWGDDRNILNGIFWRLHSGAPWRDLPGRYGPWQTVYDRFNQMRPSGLLDRVLRRLQLRLNEAGLIDPELACDAAPPAPSRRSLASGAVTAPAKDAPGRLLAATDQGDSDPTERITAPERGGDAMTSLQAVRDRFARDQGLPFAESLSEASILGALNEHGVKYRDRVFSPVATIWGFLSQVLSEDHSCRDAVSRVIAHRAAAGLEVCSPNTASYCNARARLPTAVLRSLARRTAQQLQAGLPEAWKWNGRSVFIADGSHVSMPDTPQNQAVYPQPVVQQDGIGFPLARVAVLLSLATGACHDLAIAPYAGKGTGETTLLRQLYGSLSPGDVVVADALFDNYFLACELRQRGIDLVVRVQAERVGSQVVESRPDGDIILWQRPNKPRGMSGEQYRSYPKTMLMRQVPVDARGKGNRAEQFKVATTILEASIDGGQIGGLFERRWDGEVDIRSVKSTMKMDVLRCKTPEMVRKEVWAYLLAYNLLRTVMAVAASENGVEPRAISFKGAKQALTAFAPKLEAARPQQRAVLVDAMLQAVAHHRVGNRPGRWEPRARKRRPKPSKRLNQPRDVAKLAHNRAKWY